jgi:hypothetical protein
VKKKLLSPFPTLLDSVRHPRRPGVNDSGPGLLGALKKIPANGVRPTGIDARGRQTRRWG